MAVLEGAHFVAGRREVAGGERFHAIDPRTGAELAPGFAEASEEQIERACAAAAQADAAFAASAPTERAELLRAIADGIEGLGETLVDRVAAETALPPQRVLAERGRTCTQLRQFADVAEQDAWIEASIDRGDPERQPLPKPDLRRMNVPLGPVVVFGASNFPLAYSVAGGDTASALAVGCPVIVKAHPAHPGTSELVGDVIRVAVERLDLSAGVFSLLHGRSHATGAALVRHPVVKAVGFTGSHLGGRALCDLAATRPEPIPVFAEMGSANPVVVLPNALRGRGVAIAEQLAASSLLAQGQFCTSPGLVLWVDGHGGEAFRRTLRERMLGAEAGPTVHPTIRAGYERTLQEVESLPIEVARGTAKASAATDVCPALLSATPADLFANPRLRHELYGPAMLTVACPSAADLLSIVEALDGHLTGTVHGDGDDFTSHAPLIAALRRKVGRLIANGVPTGVEVCPSMVHGGPYPAASDPRFSAVGSTSVRRWVRPVCWQDCPPDLLPPQLRTEPGTNNNLTG
ncbi:MAG TPA: aldehyde dehydrogenase (NADP(+)) [bacterium]|nr:aldehyde dehydrogenase (NADP(+)) [bacterium]